MTIIEQIKTEIERRITDNTFGAKLELIDILAWLDTLESEKLMQEELEKEIQGKRKELMEVFGPMSGEQVLVIKDFACHFYELGLNTRKR